MSRIVLMFRSIRIQDLTIIARIAKSEVHVVAVLAEISSLGISVLA